MFTQEFFEILLHFGKDWEIGSVVTIGKTEAIEIKINYVGQKAECPETKEMCNIYDHAPERKWRHLDTMQYKTYLSCKLPRVKNRKGKVVTIKPPWASKHERHTDLFERAVIDILLATKNQTKTSELMRCGFNVVNRIIHRSTARGLARRELTSVEHLSIDEKSFRKGHKYVSVLSDPLGGRVIEIGEGRKKESVKTLLENALTPEQMQAVITVSMDMWKAYMRVIKEELPNAEIVHDKFHLIKYLNDALDKVRKREVKTNEALRNSRYALLKNEENLTKKQRIKFESIRAANYEVSRAWEVRENFKSLFNKEKQRANSLKLFSQWAEDSIGKQIKEVTKVVKMFKDHITGVVNALISNFNNAMAERLNGKIQEIKLAGRGYRTFKNFRSAILFFYGDLKLYPLN